MALNRLCLDTSAYSQFRRGDAAVIKAIISAKQVYVPTIVLGELRTGFLLGSRAEENENALQAFLRETVVSVLTVDDEASTVYSEIVVNLRRAGTPLPTNDIWIAALAAREGATVLTFDEHFRLIPRISAHILSA
jgi:tRNA(fMet)-specific endonuclease VapC